MASATEQAERLEALRTAVNDYADEAIARLKAEREFLKSVLASTADASTARSNAGDAVAAITSAAELIGLT